MTPGAPQLFAPSIEQQAVRARGHASNVLVAAAGSGKTRVLTWLYCDAHVREGIALDALLAITFTDKAAGELRQRIAKELEGHTLGREPDLGDAWIGTFHGVCARILREFAHRRGLDPAFGVIEELQALELQAEAWELAVAGLLEAHGGEAGSLLAQVGGAALRDAIVEWWKARRSAGEVHPELPRPRTTAADVGHAARVLGQACSAFAGLVDDLQRARSTPLASLDLRLEITADIQQLAAHAGELAATGALTPTAVDGLTASLEARTPRRGQPIPPDRDDLERLIDARATLLRRLAEAIAAPRVDLLAELVSRFSRGYERCKRRLELLDFDDLELEALQLLREDDDVRLRLVARFERVLVDEFQDTNPRQAELVDLLAGGPMWIPVGGDGRPAVTVVGDPRQAIYGFRYADVGLIGSATDRIGEGGDLRLSTNYRSDAEVLTAIDEAFAKLDPGHEPVTAFRGPDHLPAGQSRVELLITKEERAEPWAEVDLGARAGEQGGPALAEARLLAARIEELRAAEPDRSIVVLARARSVLAPIAEALVDLGIPALTDGADGFWERLEVADLLAWLRLVRNPADDAAFVAVCASPLVGLSIDGLAAVGTLPGGVGAAPRLHGLAAALAAGEVFDPGDARRLEGMLQLFDRQREPGRSLDPAGLLDEVIAATAYDEHLLRLIGGDRRAANVTRLRRIASEIAAADGSLTDLVDRAAKEQGHALRAPEASVAGSDAVTLMTVHQAKGLEFDTVIVAGLGSPQRISAPALLGDGKRLGLRLRPSPGVAARSLFEHQALVEELQQREDAEVRRVLYVALTRARERLIVSGIARWTAKHGSPFSAEPTKTAPVLTWLAPALVPELDAVIQRATERPYRTAGGLALQVSTPGGPALRPARRAPDTPELAVHIGDGPQLARAPALGAAPMRAPRVLSYSALAAHADCGLRFHAERVLGLRGLTADRPADWAPPVPAGLDTPGAVAAAAGAPPARARTGRRSRAPSPAQLDLFSLLDDSEPVPPTTPAPAPRPLPGTDGAPAPTGPAPAALGNAVHAALEQLAPGASQAEIDAAVQALTHEPPWTVAARAEVAQLVGAGLSSAVAAELWAGGAPRRELPFTIAVGASGAMITGVLDAWKRDGDGPALVVDYKTDRVRPGDDLERKTAERYGLQRDAYALAAFRAGATQVRVVHLFLRDLTMPPVEVIWSARDAPRLEARLADAIRSVDDGPRATASPNAWTCDACPARGGLCGWPLEATRRSPGAPPPPVAQWIGDAGGLRAG